VIVVFVVHEMSA